MTKRLQVYYLFLNVLSALLMVIEPTYGIYLLALILLSFLMMVRPITLLPVLFVSSWSISFVALPGLAAFFYYLVLFLVALLFSGPSVRGWTKPPHRQIRFAALFAIWVFLTGFISISGDWFGPMKLSFYILPLILVSKISFNDMSYLRKSLIVLAAFFSVYFVFISLFAPVEFVYEQENIDPKAVDVVLETAPSFRTDMNPNTASQIILLLFIILYCSAFNTKKYWLIGFALLNFISLMYLGSRTAFFVACIIAIVYLMLSLRMSFLKKAIIFVFVSGIFIGAYSMSHRFERAERLSVASVQQDEGSGRFFTWKWIFNDVIPYNFIKGIGVGRENYEYFGFTLDADNLYIDLLCQTGIVGLILFLMFHVRTIVLLRKRRKVNRDWDFLVAVFLAYLIEGLGESVFDTPMFWYCGFIAVLALNESKALNKKKALVNL